jgi:MOSC domain-containing protein YiiM
MKLLSVNVGQPREIPSPDGLVWTGIYKEPVQGRVMLRRLNLEGDGQADLQHHGGVYQAVYAYPYENYSHWARALGRDDLTFGQFGENLTVEGLTEDTAHIGDVFRIGGAVVQVTQPRIPCYKLGLRMGSAEFPKQFLESGRVGFYLRVVEEGDVGSGDAIERLKTDPEQLTVREVIRIAFFDRDNAALIEKAIRVQALSPEWRQRFAKQLDQ